MRGLVVLERVVGEMLFPFGEHDAVDLSVSIFAGEGDVLVDLGQSATSSPMVHCNWPSRSRTAF